MNAFYAASKRVLSGPIMVVGLQAWPVEWPYHLKHKTKPLLVPAPAQVSSKVHPCLKIQSKAAKFDFFKDHYQG